MINKKNKYLNEKDVELFQLWSNYENEEAEQRKKMRNFIEELKTLDAQGTYKDIKDVEDEIFLIEKNCQLDDEKTYYITQLKKGYDVFLTEFVLDYFDKIKTEEVKNFLKRFQLKYVEEYFQKNRG